MRQKGKTAIRTATVDESAELDLVVSVLLPVVSAVVIAFGDREVPAVVRRRLEAVWCQRLTLLLTCRFNELNEWDRGLTNLGVQAQIVGTRDHVAKEVPRIARERHEIPDLPECRGLRTSADIGG